MRVVVVTPPAAFVSLATAKAHLRVEHGDDDVMIGAYVDAACANLDGPGAWLGRAIGVQTLRAEFDGFEACLLPLPYPPLIDLTAVAYDDADGVAHTVSSADYSLDPRGALRAYDATWPTARCWPGSVRVTYRAGYVRDAAADPLVAAVPAPIVAAVLLMVGDLYANRETVVMGASVASVPMSTTVENLLNPYRVYQPAAGG